MKRIDLERIADTDDDILIVARAGCGKTTALAKIAGLLDEPILALNVTKRSKRELQSALDKKNIVGIENRTFHSICREILKMSPTYRIEELPQGFAFNKTVKLNRGVEVIDEMASRRLLKSVAEDMGFGQEWKKNNKIEKSYGARIVSETDLKSKHLHFLRNWDTDDYDRNQEDTHKMVTRVLREFENVRFERGQFCFYDLVALTAALVQQSNSAVRYLTRRFPVIIVDELQDISLAQFKILQVLKANGSRLILAGDPAQFINEFMGASEKAFTLLGSSKKKINMVELTKSYRSTPAIGKVAAHIQSNIDDGYDGIIGANQKFSDIAPEVVEFAHTKEMVKALVERLKVEIKVERDDARATPKSQSAPNRIAVLYKVGDRHNRALRLLKKRLLEEGISFIQRPMPNDQKRIVQDFLNHLRSSHEPTNQDFRRLALKSAMNVKDERQRRKELIRKVSRMVLLTEKIDALLLGFLVYAKDSRSFVKPGSNITSAIRSWLYNYEDLNEALDDWQEDFEYHLQKTASEFIVLSTVHSAKGSGFKKVFILDASKRGTTNQMRSNKREAKAMSHWMYVAVTRAESQLILMCSSSSGESKIVAELKAKKLVRSLKMTLF